MNSIIHHILQTNVSVLETATGVATLWAVLYGLPNFMYQIRAGTASETANKALEAVKKLDLHVHELCRSYKKAKKQEYTAIHEMGLLYEQLEGYLRLLARDFIEINSYTTGVRNRIDILLQINNFKTEQLNTIAENYLQYEFGSHFEQKIKDQKIVVPMLRDLEPLLRKIIGDPISSRSKWYNLLIFTFSTVACYLIRVFWLPTLYYVTM